MASNVEILIRGQDQASPAIRGVGNALQGLHDTAKSSGGGIAGSLQRIGETALGFLTAQAVPALIGMGQAAISAGADYGAVMNRIQAVSGATTQELQAMNAKALELGAALPISAKDAADAMYALVTAGYSASDAIAASTGVAQLASSQMMGVGQASEIVASALRGFGMEAGQASHVVDLLSQTASISAVEVADIGETIKYVGAVAGAAHQPMEDISAAIALMGNNGIKASMAGTALRSMITNLQAPTESAAAALANMGIQTSDAGGHMLPLMDIMSQFRDRMSGMTDAQQAQIAKAIAGKEAMAGFLSIVNAAPGDFDRITSAMQNAEGATDKFATAMNKGLKFEWEQLQGSIETVLIQGFQAAQPILVAVTGAATGFVNGLGAGLQAAGPALEQVAAQITGIVRTFQSQGAVAGGGAILQALGLSPEIAGQAAALVGQIQAALQGGLAQIQAAWAANGPQITQFVMQIVGALGQLAGWLAGQLPGAISAVSGAIAFLVEHWQAVVTVVGLVLGALAGGALTGALAAIGGAFAAVAGAAATAGGILPLVGVVIAALGGPITILLAVVGALAAAWATNFLGIRDITAQAWAGIQPILLGIGATIQSAWNGVINQIAPVAQAAWGAVTAVFQTVAPVLGMIVAIVADAIKGIWSGQINGLGDIANRAWETVKVIFAGAQAALPIVVAAVAEAARGAWAIIEPNLVALAQAAWAGVQAAFTAVVAALPGIVAAIVEGVRAAWTFLQPILVTLAGMAWDAAKAIFAAVVAALPGIVAGIVEGVRVAWAFLQPHLVTLAGMAWDGVKALFSLAVTNLPGIVAAIIDGVKTAWAFLQPHLVTLAGMAWDGVKALFSLAVTNLPGIVAAIIDGIKTAWAFLQPHLVTLAGQAWEAAKALFQAMVAALPGIIQAIVDGIKAAWTLLQPVLVALANAAWEAVKALFNAATQALLGIVQNWWNGVTNSFNQATAGIRTSIETWWGGIQAYWSNVTGAVQAITSAWWNAVKSTFDLGVATVRAVVQTGWDSIKTVWNAVSASVNVITQTFWTAIKQLFSGNFEGVKTTVAQGWEALKTLWGSSFDAIKVNITTTWEAIKTVWSDQFGAIKGLTSDTWETIKGIWNEAVGKVQTLMDKLGEAFDHVSGAIKGTIDALKRLAKTAQDLAGAIPEWMRPGSPMPLGIAFEHLAGVLPQASAAMGQFGQTAQNAGASPTVDIQLLVNGQSAGNVGAFAQNLAGVVRALIPPLASLGTTVTEEVKTALGRVNEGLKSIQSILETTFRLVALTINPPGLPSVAPNSPVLVFFGNVTTWARTVVTAAAGVANGFEEVKTAGLTALNTVAGQVKSLIEATFALIAVTVNPPSLPDVMTAGNPTITWFRNVTEWAKRVTTAAAGVADGFEQIQTGGLQALNNAAGPLKALLDTTFGLIGQAANPPSLPDVTVGSPTLTWFVNATEWTKRVASAVAGVANGFESVLTAGLTALNTAAGAALGLIKTALDTIAAVADPPSIPVVTAGSTLHTFLVSLVGFARRVSEIALDAAAGFTAAAGDGLKALQEASGQALGVLKNTLDLLVVANTEYVIPPDFASTIRELATLGIQMALAFLEVANTFTGEVTPAATQAAQAMDMASKFIKDVYDLGKQIVKEPPSFPANFDQLITQLVQQAKSIATTFINEANTFATNVGPGAVALLDTYAGMDKFFKGFNKAVTAISEVGSLPSDAASKVRDVMTVALAVAREYITQANSFQGTATGATNLETTIGGFAKLVKNTKDLLKTLEDWGTAGITSDSIAPALALFASVLNTFATQSEGAGTTAGTGFMGAMAQAIRDNASQVYDALREVLAGANAIIPGGSGGGGGGGGGGGQGAGATLAGATSAGGGQQGANSEIEAAVAAGVERGMRAARQASQLEQQAKDGGGVQQSVTVNLSTAAGLDSTLTLLMNMARG